MQLFINCVFKDALDFFNCKKFLRDIFRFKKLSKIIPYLLRIQKGYSKPISSALSLSFNGCFVMLECNEVFQGRVGLILSYRRAVQKINLSM